MKLDWNFQRGGGGGGLRKNPIRGGHMDNFWNHPINNNLIGNHGLVIAEDKLIPAPHVHFQQILLRLRSLYSQTVSDY